MNTISPSPTAPDASDERIVLQAVDLKRHYPVESGFLKPKRSVKALDGVSFSLRAGQTLAVVGESGCGKSTLARVLTMIEPPTAGQLLYRGQDVASTTPALTRLRRQKIQIIFQNPYASLNPRKRIGSILEEPLLINTRLDKAQRRARGMAMMERVGLRPEHYGRYPHMFSGGQRQRIAIARGLMLEPEILVADEAVSALDVSVRAQVLNLMKDLQAEFGLSYVFISHDLSVVEHLADEVMVMYLGRVVEHGSKAAIFGQPLHPYTQALLSATPRLEGQRERIRISGELPSPLDPPPGCPFSSRCPRVMPVCREIMPELKMQGGRLVACFAVEQDLGTP
ncbi:MAG TPA: peptide ABC transporter ATP-binding protein [Castellaniella sp.]|nr:peptide ABC transporter ATP-binding protein [Castellaniella sp.]